MGCLLVFECFPLPAKNGKRERIEYA